MICIVQNFTVFRIENSEIFLSLKKSKQIVHGAVKTSSAQTQNVLSSFLLFTKKEMTESIKFGPEWLRNMSIDPGSGEGVTMRYQWPEFRYGREEMLLLFNKAKQKVPETLPRFKSLFVENIQNPLAMQPDVGDEIAVRCKHVPFLRNLIFLPLILNMCCVAF